MAPSFSELKSVLFYTYQSVRCEAKVLKSSDYNKNYIGFYKQSTYTTDEGLQKESRNYVLYTIPAAKQLLAILSDLIEDAQKLSGVK
jgi:hypothetical protein